MIQFFVLFFLRNIFLSLSFLYNSAPFFLSLSHLCPISISTHPSLLLSVTHYLSSWGLLSFSTSCPLISRLPLAPSRSLSQEAVVSKRSVPNDISAEPHWFPRCVLWLANRRYLHFPPIPFNQEASQPASWPPGQPAPNSFFWSTTAFALFFSPFYLYISLAPS